MFKPTLFAAVLLAGGVLTALELTPSADTAVYARPAKPSVSPSVNFRQTAGPPTA